MPVRQAAGEALLSLGTPECLDTLIQTIEYHDWFCESPPVRAVFKRVKEKAFDTLAKYFEPDWLAAPGGLDIAWDVLSNFCRVQINQTWRPLCWVIG